MEDVKRGQRFSKFAAEITAAARLNPDINANPSLKAAVEKARAANMPKENVERAIEHVRGRKKAQGESIILEAYAATGEGLIIEAVTENKNRTLPEIRQILNAAGAKTVGPGGVSWNFDGDKPNITKPASPQFRKLLEELAHQPEVTKVLTDAI